MARVLIVEDSMYAREVLRAALERGGHRVVGEAASGEDGLARLGEAAPDVVVLDLVMPGIGGLEFLRRARQRDPRVRVLVVSASGQDADVREALALGAADYLLKPVDERRLAEAVGLAAR